MDQKKLKIAYHEAGHAVMALICRQGIQIVSLGEMDSPKGTEKYLGFTKLQPFEQNERITIDELIRRVNISLGGYASEILFYDGRIKVGCDDLATALKWVEGMMQSESFRAWVARLPVPGSGILEMIANPAARAFIDYQIHMCVDTLAPFKHQIQLFAEKLYETDELTGDEIAVLFDASLKSGQWAD